MSRYELIPIGQIQTEPQVRTTINQDVVHSMSVTIRAVGLQQPIRVRRSGDHYVVIDGHLRLMACQLAQIMDVPAIIDDARLSAPDILRRQLITNIQRADLLPSEKSIAIQTLLAEEQCTSAQLSSEIGISAPMITRLLSLPGLPEPVRKAVDAGTIPLSTAYELSQIADPAKQLELAELAASGKLTRDAIVVAKKAAKQPTSDNSKQSRVVAFLDANRLITFAGRGLNSIEQFIMWLEELLTLARRARLKSITLGTFLKILKEQAKA